MNRNYNNDKNMDSDKDNRGSSSNDTGRSDRNDDSR